MNPKKYRITCLKCKGSNVATIIQTREQPPEYMVDLNEDHKRRPDDLHIISVRYRGDMRFGWECICGNSSLISRQEFPKIKELVVGGGKETIAKIAKSMTVEDDKKFRMEDL